MNQIVVRLLGLSALMVWVGCAGGPQPGTTTVGEPGPWEVHVVGADGDTVSVPTGNVSPAAAPMAVQDPAPKPGQMPPVDSPPMTPDVVDAIPAPALQTRDFTYGYRIQVMAASSLTAAEDAASRADSLFALHSYVEYEPPFYKVRLGDFLLKDEALAAMDSDVKQEFPKAWVAETMVARPRH